MLREGLIYLSGSRAAKAVVTRTPLRGMSRRFVPGESVDSLVDAIREANSMGLTATGNFLGESVKSEASALEAGDVYTEILERIAAEKLQANVSLKFTQLGQDISEEFLAKNLGRVLETARKGGLFIRFDMESSPYTQRTLDAFEALWAEGWRDIGVVLQSYLKRTAGDVARMNEIGARVRLCKGAYAEPAEVAFQAKADVDANFVELMRMLLPEGNYPGIATHDDRMIDATVSFQTKEGIPKDRFEFQMLHGVRRDLQQQLVTDGYNVRVYVPFGSHWYPYLMRRLAERPANVLFLAGSVVRESPVGRLFSRRNKADSRG
ncbi:MAG: proline dehydrogenase family protein [Gemmatimonadota bacterium]|nr:proline dehydrogenase family protein [Gemmatimonadota bacterium]